MKEQKTKRKHNNPIDSYSLSEMLYLFLSRWYWFVLSILITTSYSAYKVVTTRPLYTRYAMVHIESANKSNLTEQMENFANMGVTKSSTNAYNEYTHLYRTQIGDNLLLPTSLCNGTMYLRSRSRLPKQANSTMALPHRQNHFPNSIHL